MKRIGLLGGMSWESSIEYERLLNEGVRDRLGGTHSADLIVRSYDFAQIEDLQAAGRWVEAGELLANDAAHLQAGGAELIAICTNTMHLLADEIVAAIDVPLVHLVDVTAAAVHDAGLSTVVLLGTRYTMEHPFYRERLEAAGLEVIVPGEADRTTIHDVIYDELVRGTVRPASRVAYLEIIDRLAGAGQIGVIAACTEIELLVTADDLDVPYFPTTRLHAAAIVDAALS